MASEPVDRGGIDGDGENPSFRVYTRKGKGQRKQAPYFAEAIGEKPEGRLENGKEDNLVSSPETLAREPVDSIGLVRNSIEETATETIPHEEVKSSIAKNSIEARKLENEKENNLVNPPETLAREDSIAVVGNSIEDTATETVSHEEVKSSSTKNSIEAPSENLPDIDAVIVIDKPLVEALSQSQIHHDVSLAAAEKNSMQPFPVPLGQDDVNTIVGEKSVEIPSQNHAQDDVNTVVVDENSIKEPLKTLPQEDVVTVIVDKSPIKAPSQTLSTEDVNIIVVDKNPIEVTSEEHIHVVDEDNLIKEVHRENLVEQDCTDAQQPTGSMPMEEGVDGRNMAHLPSRTEQQKEETRKKLEDQLTLVRDLVRKIEAKEDEISAANDSRVLVNTITNNGGGRILSGFASAGLPREVVRASRPLNQLSISVLENTQGTNELVEREKRTPKANQFYRTSEFLLGDTLPPAENTKKTKSSAKKQGRENMHGFGAGSKTFKSCSALLERLIKHKHGWVFNAPVDVKGLGLHDYFIIINNPMDLGTVKSKLTKNLYKAPRDFAEDVRLTFHNAMTYNPKGQDVHVMAEQLLQIFEERWAIIEADYIQDLRFTTGYEVNLPTPTMRSRLGPKMVPPPINVRNTFDRTDWSSHHAYPQHPKPTTTPGRTPSSTKPYGRQPALRKPKASEPNKRDMTQDEKQKLSAKLQNLPADKLDTMVQIINKRNTAVKLRDEEIEVDIDSVEPETLWELDRFVTNYKKGLSKKKRKAELAIQARAEAERNNQLQMQAPAPVAHEHSREGGTTAKKTLPPHLSSQAEKLNTETSSSSSSSSDSTSSSDSDSDSSSSSGSDQT